MKIQELRAFGEAELKQKMQELYKELMKDNAQIATGTIPKNPGKIRMTKKTIARIKTILTSKKPTEASPNKFGQPPSSKNSEVAKKA